MKLSQIIALITLFFLLVPYLSFAQVPPPGEITPPEIPRQLFSCLPTDPLRICMLRIFDSILKVILVLALILAALMVAWAGILYIIRGGEGEEKQTKVRNKIIFAAFGLVIAFLAWIITVILARVISGGSLTI
jgi:hypothetical protein